MGPETRRDRPPRSLPAVALLGAALLLGACAAPVPEGASPSAASLPPLTPPPGGATPPPTAPVLTATPPALSGDLTCGSEDLVFPADTLRQGLPGTGGDAAAAALLAYLGNEPALAGAEWRRVLEREDRVSFVAPGPDGWAFVTVARTGGGAWEAWESGACRLAVVLPAGVGFMVWRLDPASPPDPASASLTVLANEIACASGKPPVGRTLAPTVLETPDSVTIVLMARTVGGDCPGNPEVPITVELAEPLGARRLFDGSVEPPEPRD